jgi:Helix-turn-helix domain
VASLRQYHEIPIFDRAVDRHALLTIAEAATMLGVSAGTVRRMLMARILPGTQPVAHAPWAIQAADLTLERVQRAVAAVHQGRSLPRPAPAGQLALDKSHT